MAHQIVSIIFWKGKAFVPFCVETESGLIVDSEPVFTIPDDDLDQLALACEQVMEIPRPKIPDRTRDDWKNWRDPILATTKAKSWRGLAKEGASYSIGIYSDKMYLEMSRVDKHGRWEYDPERRRIFTPNTPIREVVQVILEDWTRQKASLEKKGA